MKVKLSTLELIHATIHNEMSSLMDEFLEVYEARLAKARESIKDELASLDLETQNEVNSIIETAIGYGCPSQIEVAMDNLNFDFEDLKKS